MTELVTEISGSDQRLTTVEFLGSTFAERKQALAKVNAFKKLAEQALVDSVTSHVGNEVLMTYRPSMTYIKKYNAWVSCYSLDDEVREPYTQEVTIRSVEQQSMSATISHGEAYKGRYEQMWTVGLNNILSIEPVMSEPVTEG